MSLDKWDNKELLDESPKLVKKMFDELVSQDERIKRLEEKLKMTSSILGHEDLDE